MFIMHIHKQQCNRCGNVATISRIYEANEVAAPGSASKMQNATSVGPLDPVHKQEITEKPVPCCYKCVDDTILLHGAEIYARWQETLKRKSQERAAPPTAHREPKPRGTRLEDLA